MKIKAIIIYFFCFVLIISCQNSFLSTSEFKKNNPNFNQVLVDSILADTVYVYISNGSLPPNYQYELEWMVTDNLISFKEFKGGKLKTTLERELINTDWKKIRTFNPKFINTKDTLFLDGIEEQYINFIVKDKKYIYPSSNFQEKIEQIKDYFK